MSDTITTSNSTIHRILPTLLTTRPHTPNQLHALIKHLLGFHIPRRAIVDGHQAPFDYVCHAFFEDNNQPRDCVVWANRGGGKTQLGAIVTLLEMIYKPGIQIRILAGSFEQSSRMYAALRQLFNMHDELTALIDGRMTERYVQLNNGSRVEVLSQSERAVRGQRIHKLRCDEVELFDDDIWQAAQMVTRSGKCGDIAVHGCIEAISTMHRPYGLMRELIEECSVGDRTLFCWSVLDVLERCPAARNCTACSIEKDCLGRAKSARGYVKIDDAIRQSQRVGSDVWQAEMLCQRPSVSGLVYPRFDTATHVRESEELLAQQPGVGGEWLGGIDFGYRSPTVVLFGWHDWASDVLFIVDEHIATERTTQVHIDAVAAKPWPRPNWIGADPAGHQRNEQSGRSSIALWKDAGFVIRTQSMSILAGIEHVRARIERGDGSTGLIIHPRCRGLVDALRRYHFPVDRIESDVPVKDGPDHACDALRYLISNLDNRSSTVQTRGY